MKTTICILFTFFFTTTIVFSQSNLKNSDTLTIEHQFEYLIKSSNRYEDYRVVKTHKILQLKSNILDSISASRKKVLEANSRIDSQNNSIDSLTTTLNASKENILSLKNQTDSISFIGIDFNKGVFKTLLLSIIAILLILLLFFISKFKQSNAITVQAKEDLKLLDEEFELHRKTALEREQKVRRQLQDELNKHKKEK